ncbi:hypothetical protein RQP46_011054 [Phenoliferia psychrophenolica]
MPQELLTFTPSYCLVGAYRLITDDKLWFPIWQRSKGTLKKSSYFLVPFSLVSYPLTRLYVTLILARSPFAPSQIHDAAVLGVSVAGYTTAVLVLGQVSYILEWLLRRQISKGREEVYDATVKSRAKAPDFWGPYVEEWAVPPLERAKRSAEKQSFFSRLGSPIVRMIVLKVLLTPLSFIPFLSLAVSSALRSLTMGRILHKPYFAAKKMTPLQIELFVVERQTEYRMFGFVAAAMERVPVVGLIFSISNRIGAAMWAHDLEKQQHLYSSGAIPRTKEYRSKTALIAPSDLPDEFVGGFPTKKGPVRIERDGSEVLGGALSLDATTMHLRTFLATCTLVTVAMTSPTPDHQVPFLPSSRPHILSSQPITLADLLTSGKACDIAYSYIRDSEAVSSLLIAPKPSYTTLLIPVNSAIMSLARKPHQGPPPPISGGEIKGVLESEKQHEEECRAYEERWVKLHVIPGKVGEKEGVEHDTMVEGRKISFVRALDGAASVYVMPGRLPVLNVLEASNGKIIFLDGALSLEDA